MDAIPEHSAPNGTSRPGHVTPKEAFIDQDAILVLPMQKRMVVQYATTEDGRRELRLYYGSKEISFDEPELFTFGETLARQSRFRAGEATRWGGGYAWPQLKDLFEQLIGEGVLEQGADAATLECPADRAQPSPLPEAAITKPRTWDECEAITRELAGREVETGYLELIVPIFRVAHYAMDADGRQVGEANVFPRSLRLDVPTEWMTCIYPGTRFMADRPMNVTALKAMRTHWPQMMAGLQPIRAAYLRRFPEARDGWTVGHLERLATSVLAVPTYQLMRRDRPVPNGGLHPALSSLFRVTDGLRMTMHQMLFIPFGEPTLSPHDPMTSERIFAYVERNYSFHSDTGVCAGPKNMVQEFLGVLVDGQKSDKYGSLTFDPEVEAALNDIELALDYALLGLQAYAVTFSLWPLMTRTYEKLANIAEAAVADGARGFSAFNDRMGRHLQDLKTSPYLAKEAWRADRDNVYADMYEQCGRGVSSRRAVAKLHHLIAPVRSDQVAALQGGLREAVKRQMSSDAAGEKHVNALVTTVGDFVARTQAILREAAETQSHINRLLGRASPTRRFDSRDMDVHNLLQGAESRRLPYLLDELEDTFGLTLTIETDRIALTQRRSESTDIR